MRTDSTRIWIVAGVLCGWMAVAVHGDGFRNPPEGSAALGRAGARLTQGDDPSAVTHNPANLLDMEDGPVVMPSATLGYVSTKYTSPFGATEKSRDAWRVLPALYAAGPLAEGRYAWGLGVHFPYGQSTKWNREGVFGIGTPYHAEMTTLNVSPAVAVRLTDRLSAGVGLNLMRSDMEFRMQLPWLPPPAGLTGPVSALSFEGDGYGLGARAGLTWQVTERQRVAITYQSPVDIDYKGDFEMANPPPEGVWPVPVAPSSDFETTVRFPTVVAMGYGVQATAALRLEAYAEWVEHSRNDRMDLDIGANNDLLMLTMGSTSMPQDWDDTWAFGIGADWQVAPGATVRAGWTYLPTPVPDETFMPTLPEGDKNILALGLGLASDRHALDLAYALNLTESRTIEGHPNPAVNGKYTFDAHLIGVSYRYAW